MPDIFDQASNQEDRDREMLTKIRRQEGPRETGRCLNCGEPVPAGRRWCDHDCLSDWQARQKK